jgi:hypothetical protein
VGEILRGVRYSTGELDWQQSRDSSEVVKQSKSESTQTLVWSEFFIGEEKEFLCQQ